MKRLMVKVLALAMVCVQFSSSAQSDPKQQVNESIAGSKVGLYYFHFARRCNTCIAVEQNSQKAFGELYPEQIKTGEYFFMGVNLDEESGKEIGEKMGIGMQTLMVVRGDNRVDITGEGFMNADNYEKLKAEVKKAVDKVLTP